MNSLETRKRLLIAESGRLRQELAVELESLRPLAVWVDRGWVAIQSVRDYWKWIAALAGILIERKAGPWLRVIRRVRFWTRVGEQVGRFWRQYRPDTDPNPKSEKKPS